MLLLKELKDFHIYVTLTFNRTLILFNYVEKFNHYLKKD